MNSLKEIRTIQTRTPFQRAIKQALLTLGKKAGIPEETKQEKAESLELPVDSNNKPVLVDLAEENDINVSEPKHKAQYVDAINAFLEKE